MNQWIFLLGFVAVFFPLKNSSPENTENSMEAKRTGMDLIVLGTLQDGGSPHLGCQKNCCLSLHQNPDPSRRVVSLGIVDHELQESYLFEASPDFVAQVHDLQSRLEDESSLPKGIFLSHAHMGHYTGLMHLGKEAMNADRVNCYVMPRMKEYLSANGPWSQLVELKNIQLHGAVADSALVLNKNLKVTPLLVPHRDEFSETVGFLIQGRRKTALFIPDIDKWSKWDRDILQWIKKVDYAFLDATFYDSNELPNRDMAEVPHPFVSESMRLFKDLKEEDKSKIHFIHLNHSNPLIDNQGKEFQNVEKEGFNVAQIHDQFHL